MTGFMRTAVIAYALGTLALADAYNNANTFPNAVFDLLLGGILTSVFVPLLVNAAKRDADGGRAYDQRMFTLVTIALAVITFVATLAAPVLVTIYAHSVHGPERALMVTFARFFIPQIFFYGICALAGAILNARGRFAAPMWTPVVNNIVVIFVITLYMITAGTGVTVSTITPAEVRLLGIGTTLGIIAQAAAMIPALRRVGFRWRPQLGLSRDEMAEIWRMAGWMFGYVVTTQIALLVTQNLANDAAVRAEAANIGYGAGFSAYQYGVAALPASVCDRGHLGDHRAAAAHERACGGRQVFACQAGLLRRRAAGIRNYGSGRCRARGARALAGCPAARARQHIGCRRHFRRRGVRCLLPRSRAIHAVPAIAAGVLRDARQPDHGLHRPRGDGREHRGERRGRGAPARRPDHGRPGRGLRCRERGGHRDRLDDPQDTHGRARRQADRLDPGQNAARLAARRGLRDSDDHGRWRGISPGPVNGLLTAVLGGGGALLMYLLFARALGVGELADLAGTITARFRGGRHRPG